MTDSLEARRAALVENLTRLGFVKEHNGYGWDRWKRPTGGGQVLVSASPMAEGSSSGFLVWAEDQIAPLLAIEAAAFARGVESRPPVDVEAALDEWARKTLRYAMNVGREDFGSPTRAELLDLLRTVTTPSEPLTLAQLEALPVGSVVLDGSELSWQTDESGMWTRLDWRCTSGDMLIAFGPVRLLHTGTVTTREG